MIYRISLIALVCGVSLSEQEVKKEENVLVLNQNNFDEVVNNNNYVLVEFYAPWCRHCKALAPQYAKAATQLAEQKSDIRLAKVDVTVEKDLAKRFNVSRYPTLKFFINGRPSEYSGGRTADDLIKWLKKRTTPAAVVELCNPDEASAFKQSASVVVIGYFKNRDTPEAQLFLEVAEQNGGEHPFGITSVDSVAKQLSIEKEGVVRFKSFDELSDDLTLREKITADEALKTIIASNNSSDLT